MARHRQAARLRQRLRSAREYLRTMRRRLRRSDLTVAQVLRDLRVIERVLDQASEQVVRLGMGSDSEGESDTSGSVAASSSS